MNKNENQSKKLLEEIKNLYENVTNEASKTYGKWEAKIDRQEFEKSAENLSHYLALRRRDIRHLQKQLAPLGLSSLGRLESNTKSSLENVIAQLSLHVGEETDHTTHTLNSFSKGRRNLESNTAEIFGEKPENRDTRIMVTLPTHAADDLDFLVDLISKGMDVARINCAHDNEEIWEKMINNIRTAEEQTGKNIKILMDISGPKIRTDWVFTTLKQPKVTPGDYIRLTNDYETLPKNDFVKVTAGCSLLQVFESLKKGDPLSIDDGSVETEVESVNKQEVILKVKNVKGNSKRIKAEKGLNLPETQLDLDIFTEKDKEDIVFAANNADILGCSFIRNAKDMETIQKEIDTVMGDKASEIKLMAKIETVQAVENLPEIIMTAAGKNPFSVMIARGDLAVETGYIRLAEVQQEILWISEAADIPVVWGTEVLDNLIDEGVPTRSEVTDAAEGARSECVMLNKGDYINQGVETLNEILEKMKEHQYKKIPLLRALNIAKIDY